MNCPICGRELADGETCVCTLPESEASVQEEPVLNQQPQYNYYDPTQATQPQQPYYIPVAPTPVASTDYPEGYKPKKKYVACILALALGVFGMHNFYLGNKDKALAQLLIAVLGSLVLGIGAIVVEIWSLIELVQILTEKIDADANGYKIQTLAEEIAKAQKD